MAIEHENAAQIHKFAFVAGSDPGAVGAYKGWVDTSVTPYRFKVRNAGNSAWEDIGIYDADLITIAALTPSNDDVLQRKSDAWTNRTLAQLKADLALNNVPNVDARARASHTGTQLAATISDFNTAVDARITIATGSFGTIATQDADAVNISGGLIASIDMDTINMNGDIFFNGDGALKLYDITNTYYTRFLIEDDDLSSNVDFRIDFNGASTRYLTLNADTTLAGTNTGDETTSSLGTTVSGAVSKAVPVDADLLALTDSTTSHVVRKLSWSNIKKGIRGVEQSVLTADSLTLDVTYLGKQIKCAFSGVGVTTLTFPGTSTLTTAFGCFIYNETDENVILEPAVGVTIVGGTTLEPDGYCELVTVGTNKYKVIGEAV